MSRILILEGKTRKTFFKADAETYILAEWLECGLVDILERHLHISLSALRRITGLPVTRKELEDSGAFDSEELAQVAVDAKESRKNALQAPSDIINTIDILLGIFNTEGTLLPQDFLEEVTQHPSAVLFYEEEAYFSNGQFAEDLLRLRVMAEQAKTQNIKSVRIIIDYW